MRYVVCFVFLVPLLAVPSSVSAQPGEEGTAAQQNVEEPASSTEPAPEEPALQLKRDDAGVEVAPSPRLTPATEYRKAQARRARAGLAVSVIFFGGGVVMMGVGFANLEGASLCLEQPCPEASTWPLALSVVGPLLTIGGLAGTIIAGKRLTERKAELRRYASAPETRHGTRRRVQWDIARSRLVF